MSSGVAYCSIESDSNRHPKNCVSEITLNAMIENVTKQLFCSDNDLFKGASMLSLVTLRSCIDCYKKTIGEDDYINNFIASYDNLVLQASEDLRVSFDKLTSLISLYNTNFKTINNYINEILESEPVNKDDFELDYCRDKGALNALANLF